MRQTHTKFLTTTACVIALLVLCSCTRLMFVPMRNYMHTPDEAGIEYEDVYLPTQFGTRLHGWLLKSKTPAKGNVLYIHGNGENISTHFISVAWLTLFGYNVLVYDFQGYGKSSGSPSVADEISNVEVLAKYLAEFGKGPFILYGQSMGGAIAMSSMHIQSVRENVSLMVIESSFPNYRRIVQERLGSHWLTWSFQWPVSLGFVSRNNPEEVIGTLAPIPILIIHGKRDHIVRFENGVELFSIASKPSALWVVEDGGHIMGHVIPEFRASLVELFDEIAEHRAPTLTAKSFNLPQPVVDFLKQHDAY